MKKPKPGIESLAAAVIRDMEKGSRKFCEGCTQNPKQLWKFLLEYKSHDYTVCPFSHGSECCQKFKWVCDRAFFIGLATGLDWKSIVTAWEKDRMKDKWPNWYMNYYQPINQPAIGGAHVFVYENGDEAVKAFGKDGFICPACGHVGTSPYKCDSEDCNWVSYGLFGTLGKGAFVFLKDKMLGENIFMPVALAGDAE